MLLLLSIIVTVLIGGIDYLLGYELSMAIFYVIPVVVASWSVGRDPGYLVSVLSAAAVYFTEELTRPPFVHPLAPVWKGTTALCFFLMITWLVAGRKRDEERRNQLMAQLKDIAITEERNRIAGELHDTMAQALTGMLFQIRAVRDIIAATPGEATQCMHELEAMARTSLGEMRRSVWALRPAELGVDGLVDATQRFLQRLAAGAPAAIEFSHQGTPYPLPEGVAQGLLRICQEAVVNALRHAEASKIQVRSTYQPSMADLYVRDNGRGFDSHAAPAGKGFGLTSMRERAKRIGGQLEVLSEPGVGTQVIAVARVPEQSSAGGTGGNQAPS
jgi:signal transduction histidine kinase